MHDTTGLTGLYDIKLHYRKDETAPDNPDNADAPSIFTALEDQLGLKLVADKGPVDTLVIDAAQKPNVD